MVANILSHPRIPIFQINMIFLVTDLVTVILENYKIKENNFSDQLFHS